MFQNIIEMTENVIEKPDKRFEVIYEGNDVSKYYRNDRKWVRETRQKIWIRRVGWSGATTHTNTSF